MKYLLKENRELKGQILDYQSLVTLNKEALKVGLGLTPVNLSPTTQNSDQISPQKCKFLPPSTTYPNQALKTMKFLTISIKGRFPN
jgi:hypothetical protein